MSELSQLKAPEGSIHKKKRVGRGESSGLGKTCGVGHKGQKARQGTGKPRRGFEGGQMTLARRLPKRGFFSRNRVEYAIVNLSQLEKSFDANTEITLDLLRQHGMVKKGFDLLKVLADGELSKPFTVTAHKFSKAAQDQITKAGGQVKSID